MNVTLCLILIVIVSCLVLYVLAKFCRYLQDENTRLELELSKQKHANEEYCQYIKQISSITKTKDKVAEKIREAKNDEEILDIIAGLVSNNNDLVRK